MKLWVRIVIGAVLGGIFSGGLAYFVWYFLLVTFHTNTGLFDQLVIPIGTLVGAIYSFAGGGISGGIISWKGLKILPALLTGGFITIAIPALIFGTARDVEFEIWLCVLSSFPIGALAGCLVSLINRKISKSADD
ncbi:MAG: hypothetical protein R2681_15325 [Pyrinomonadaceae bacterium]